MTGSRAARTLLQQAWPGNQDLYKMNHPIQPIETGNQTNDAASPPLEFGQVIDLHPLFAAMAQAREAAEANGTEPADIVWDPAWSDLPVDNDDYWNDLVERNWETLSRWHSMSLWASQKGKLLHFKVVDGRESASVINVAPPSTAIETMPDTQPAIILPLDGTAPQHAENFIKAVFGQTNEPVHFCSLGNERDGKHPFKKLDTRDSDKVTGFIARWDLRERGMFYGVSTLKQGSQARNKENVSELPMLFADIDLKDVDESIEGIERKLKMLRFPPSIVVRSGNGIHAIWLLKEYVELQSEGMIDRIEGDLRQLADLVGGDLQVCEVARLMRLPGSHNSKGGAWKPVEIAHPAKFDGEIELTRYELDDLEEWFGEQSPTILRKVRPRAITVEQAIEADPYLAYYKENGFKPPIDIEARLNAMMFMGGKDANGNDTSIHGTQIAVAASMVGKGHTDDEIVEVLMAATKAAAGDYGKRWNWRVEEGNIRKDIVKWRKEHPPKTKSVEREAKSTNPAPASTSTDSPTGSNVVSLAGAAAARKPKPKPTLSDSDANHIKIGSAVLDVIKGRGDDLLFTEKAAWICTGGLWTMMTDSDGWLNVEIEKAIMGLGYTSTKRLRGETLAWIKCRPHLWRKEVDWDGHGKVPTLSGLVDPRTLEVTPLKPEHYATWRIECEYDPAATCPWWLQMLEDCFEDRMPEERVATIRVIQELLGAGLIDEKPRALSRALIFQGGSNFGKSGLLEVMGGLFGRDQNSTPIEALEGTHGMMPFVKRMPWVLHEAFDQRKWHFSSAVKAIITGEPISVNIKNGPMLSLRVRAPNFWGTNHPPQFKEATKAIVNRLVVIECRREFIEGKPVGAAIEAFKRGMDKPSSLVLADEKPGLLRWALEGLKRALQRGFIEQTKDMKEAGEQIRIESNLVAGFIEECVVYDCDRRVSSPDFCLAFSAYFLENKGENRQVPSNDVIGKALMAMSDSKIAIDRVELRDMNRRYYAGIRLNPVGLAFHQAGFTNNDLLGKTASASVPGEHVNTLIPDAWLEKPSIQTMRRAHGMDQSPEEIAELVAAGKIRF
jgi:hypothetical protein